MYVELPISFEHSTKFGISDDLQSLDYRMCSFNAISQKNVLQKDMYLSFEISKLQIENRITKSSLITNSIRSVVIHGRLASI